MDAQHAGGYDDITDDAANNVTAVTSENGDRFAYRRVDALMTMAETSLRHGPGPQSSPERYQVVVHVTAETLATSDAGCCELDSGQWFNAPSPRSSAIHRICSREVSPIDWTVDSRS